MLNESNVPKKSWGARTARFFFDVPTWMGWNSISRQGEGLAEAFLAVIRPEIEDANTAEPRQWSDFEAVMREKGLTDGDVQKRCQYWWRLSLLYILIGLLLWSYASYMLWHGHWESGILSGCIGAVPVAYAFTSHFYYTQLRMRRLDISRSDWWAYWISGSAKQ